MNQPPLPSSKSQNISNILYDPDSKPLKIFEYTSVQNELIIFSLVIGGLILFTYFISAIAYLLKQRKRIRDDKLMSEHSDIGDSKYLIIIFTAGPKRGAKPTTAKVTIHLFGSESPGKIHELKPKGGFLPYTREKFVVNEDVSLGVVRDLLIQTDNSGDSPKWFCHSIVVRSLETNDAWYFFADAVIEFPPRMLTARTTNDLIKNYFIAKRCFRREWRQGQHIYYGLLNWSPRSVYTIWQRTVTALVANLYLVAMTLLIINFVFEPWNYKKTKQSIHKTQCLVDISENILWSSLVLPSPFIAALFTLVICTFLVRLFRDPENYEQRFDEMDFVIDTALKSTADKKHEFRLSLLIDHYRFWGKRLPSVEDAKQKRLFVDEKSRYHFYSQVEEKSQIYEEDDDDEDDINDDDNNSLETITSVTLAPKVVHDEVEDEEAQIIKSKISKSGRGIKENVFTSHHQSRRESTVQHTLNWQQFFHGPIHKTESQSFTEHHASNNRALVENISIRRLSRQRSRKISDLIRLRPPEELRAEMRQLFNLVNVDASGNAIKISSNFSDGARGSIDYEEMQKMNLTIGMIDLTPTPRNFHEQPKLAWVFVGVSLFICSILILFVFLFPNFTECNNKETTLIFLSSYLAAHFFGILFEMVKIGIFTVWHMKTDKHYYNSIDYVNNVNSLNQLKNAASIVQNIDNEEYDFDPEELKEDKSDKSLPLDKIHPIML